MLCPANCRRVEAPRGLALNLIHSGGVKSWRKIVIAVGG